MITNEEKILYKTLSYNIIGLAMEVHSKLGYGFLEKYTRMPLKLRTLQRFPVPTDAGEEIFYKDVP